MNKKLMILGGGRYAIPLIKVAHDLGIEVITADYLPDNIAHKYSDRYVNVNIVDRDAVLRYAEELHIDGINSFGTDPGVVTAAYVGTKMGLPTPGPINSVMILQDKGQFREFLRQHGFLTPWTCVVKSYDEVNRTDLKYPMIVKPVDSAGSKGVSCVNCEDDLKNAISVALEKSIKKQVILEEFLVPEGFPTDCDSFIINGEIVSFNLNNQHFDIIADNPYTPAAYTWPCGMSEDIQNSLKKEIERLLKLLNMRTGIFNIETRKSKGVPFIMECSPRGGGNRLAEIVRMGTGIDMIEASVRDCLGMEIGNCLNKKRTMQPMMEVILHSDKGGVFRTVEISDIFKKHVVEKDIWIKEGEEVNPFTGANQAIGTLVLGFDDVKDLNEMIDRLHENVKICVA